MYYTSQDINNDDFPNHEGLEGNYQDSNENDLGFLNELSDNDFGGSLEELQTQLKEQIAKRLKSDHEENSDNITPENFQDGFVNENSNSYHQSAPPDFRQDQGQDVYQKKGWRNSSKGISDETPYTNENYMKDKRGQQAGTFSSLQKVVYERDQNSNNEARQRPAYITNREGEIMNQNSGGMNRKFPQKVPSAPVNKAVYASNQYRKTRDPEKKRLFYMVEKLKNEYHETKKRESKAIDIAFTFSNLLHRQQQQANNYKQRSVSLEIEIAGLRSTVDELQSALNRANITNSHSKSVKELVDKASNAIEDLREGTLEPHLEIISQQKDEIDKLTDLVNRLTKLLREQQGETSAKDLDKSYDSNYSNSTDSRSRSNISPKSEKKEDDHEEKVQPNVQQGETQEHDDSVTSSEVKEGSQPGMTEEDLMYDNQEEEDDNEFDYDINEEF